MYCDNVPIYVSEDTTKIVQYCMSKREVIFLKNRIEFSLISSISTHV